MLSPRKRVSQKAGSPPARQVSGEGGPWPQEMPTSVLLPLSGLERDPGGSSGGDSPARET